MSQVNNRVSRPAVSTKQIGTPQNKAQTYQIKSGDTLSGIARQFALKVSDLMSANEQIKDANLIYAGQELQIPSRSEAKTQATKAKKLKQKKELALDKAGLTSKDKISQREQGKASKQVRRDAEPARDQRVDENQASGLTGLLTKKKQYEAHLREEAKSQNTPHTTKQPDESTTRVSTKPEHSETPATQTHQTPAHQTEVTTTKPQKPAVETTTTKPQKPVTETSEKPVKAKKEKKSKLRKKAEKAIGKELQKEHKVDTKVKITDDTKVNLGLHEQVLLPTDKKISGDPLKKQTSVEMGKNGDKVAWAKVGGKIGLDSDEGFSAGSSTFGFPAGAKLEYELTTPFVYAKDGKQQSLQAAKDVAKDNTFEMPINGKKARELKPGSEFHLRGEAHVGVDGHYTEGDNKASAGMLHSRPVAVDVHKLKGDQVQIKVTIGADNNAEISAGHDFELSREHQVPSQISVDHSQDDSPPATEETSTGHGFNTTIDGQDGSTSSSVVPGHNTGRTPPAGLQTTETVREKIADGNVSVGLKHSDSERHTETYTLDLSKPGARKAYKRLLRGDISGVKTDGRKGIKRALSSDKGKGADSAKAKAGLDFGDTQIEAGLGAKKDYSVKTKELGDQRFQVKLTHAKQLSANAGLGSDLSEGLAGTISAKGKRGLDQVDQMTFDLKQPGAKEAMLAMQQGDMKPALAMIKKGQSGVLQQKHSEQAWSSRKLAAGLETKLTNGFGAGLSLYQEKISEKDPRIAKNATRKRMSAEAKKQGKKITWHGSGGALEPSVSSKVNVGGIGVGFATEGILEYHAVTPKMGKSAKNDGVLKPSELPLDAKRASALPEGSEVVLHGAGKVALSVEKGQGAKVSYGPVSAGYSVGVETQVSTSKDMGLSITKLKGSKVRVVLADREAKGADISLKAEAGLSLDKATMPGGSALAGLVGDKLADKAKSAVSKKFGEILSAKASMGKGVEKAERDVVSYDFDLSTKTGREAYNRILKLDARSAAKAASDPNSGVSFVGSLDEKTKTKTSHAEAKIFGMDLYSSKAERRERVATLVNSKGTTRIQESEFTKSKKGLLKKGSIEWEAIQVKHEESGQSERFLHLKLKDFSDKWTSDDELKRTENFVDMMGAKVTERKIKDEHPNWWNRNVNPAAHGKTTSSADIYFTQGAMQQVAKASDEQAMVAFAKSTMKLDGQKTIPAWASPDMKVRAEALKLLKEHDDNMAMMDDEDTVEWRKDDYSRLSDGDIDDDLASYKEAKDFTKFVHKSRLAKDENAQLRAFADLGSKRKFDFHATIGAMNELATDDVILLNKLEMTGKEATIKTSSEGGIADPDTEVSNTFELESKNKD